MAVSAPRGFELSHFKRVSKSAQLLRTAGKMPSVQRITVPTISVCDVCRDKRGWGGGGQIDCFCGRVAWHVIMRCVLFKAITNAHAQRELGAPPPGQPVSAEPMSAACRQLRLTRAVGSQCALRSSGAGVAAARLLLACSLLIAVRPDRGKNCARMLRRPPSAVIVRQQALLVCLRALAGAVVVHAGAAGAPGLSAGGAASAGAVVGGAGAVGVPVIRMRRWARWLHLVVLWVCLWVQWT